MTYVSGPMSTDQHEALPIIYRWLDDTFHGVRFSGTFVLVPLPPDTPFMVGAYDAPVSGRLLDIRSPVLRGVNRTSRLSELISENDGLADEGYVRVLPRASEVHVADLEIRYTIAANTMNRDSLVQLGLRMSLAADRIGRMLQPEFGGSLVKSPPQP